MVLADYQAGRDSAKEWSEQKKRDIQQLNAEKPSIIENLNKKAWMSDRNLGLAPATHDIYQATLLSTCYNPDSIHFKDTEYNDVNNRDNLERFAKWGLGQSEANFFPEVDDFISNRIGLGFSLFKIEWEVKYEWIDKRIPKYSLINRKKITGYEIKTEQRRFERGVIRNIDNLDDIVMPDYGKHIQDLPFIIEVLHLYVDDLLALSKRNQLVKFSHDDVINLKRAAGLVKTDDQRAEVAKALGQKPLNPNVQAANEEKNLPVQVYEWHGWYEKNGRRERYRFWVEPTTEKLLCGKPLRKINRSGKYPYVGGSLRRKPGFIRGVSLTSLIAPAINALNNNYNQTSDFQYVENMPFGFANLDEMSAKSMYDLEPGVLFNVSTDPSKAVYFPNLTRSLAWSYQDKQFLMEMIERMTGAATYFMTSKTPDATATRDQLVEEKGNTKFGLWVKRIQSDISEAVNMWIQLYQEWAPPMLGERVLGEDGKKLFTHLSIDSLRGSYDAYMTPDITNGSKAYERQMKLWGLQQLSMQSIWFNPQMNPRGNWMLTSEAMKAMGYPNPEHYMPPKPKDQLGYDKKAEEHFAQIMQGENPEPPDENNPQIVECLGTFLRLKDERYHDLDEEYRPNFDAYLFTATLNYSKFMKNLAAQQMQMQIAAKAAMNMEQMVSSRPGPTAPPPTAPAAGRPAAPLMPKPGPMPGMPPQRPNVPDMTPGGE